MCVRRRWFLHSTVTMQAFQRSDPRYDTNTAAWHRQKQQQQQLHTLTYVQRAKSCAAFDTAAPAAAPDSKKTVKDVLAERTKKENDYEDPSIETNSSSTSNSFQTPLNSTVNPTQLTTQEVTIIIIITWWMPRRLNKKFRPCL